MGSTVLAEATLSSGAVSFGEKRAAGTYELAKWCLGDKTHAPAESAAVTEVVQ